MELLIVIGLVAALGVAALVLLDPKKQIEKSWDAKRKTELSSLSKKLEDWYNDKNCYPKPNQICDDNPTNTASGQKCHICGSVSTPAAFKDYVNPLPCDPEHPRYDYVYETENTVCPSWYRLYSKLDINADSSIASMGCTYGCGPGPDYAYNYGVSSPNMNLETNPIIPTPTPTSLPTPTAGPTAIPTPIPPPTTVPSPTITPVPTNVPVQGACISQYGYGSCNQYCASIDKTCFSNTNNYTYKGYTDGSCTNFANAGCTSGGSACCFSWPNAFTRVTCYCQ